MTANPSRPRLLIVDDDPAAIQVLHRILGDLGEIAFATSGAMALARLRGQIPDLILLDAEMPGMDGFATCHAIKADPAAADVPVLFVTSSSDVETEIRALELGAVDFIHKPVSAPVVRARVRTHLTLKQKSDELHRLITTDSLTGIANRRAFDDALAREWRRAARQRSELSLIIADVDHFKRYNDHFGHPAGDECLRQVARALAGSVARAGDVAARYGGEEFAILLPQTSGKDAAAVAEKICHRIRGLGLPHPKSDAGIVTVSLGVASVQVCCGARFADVGTCPANANPGSCTRGRLSLVCDAD
jgi:diguanylate cyclase (GGDEF)-like protein